MAESKAVKKFKFPDSFVLIGILILITAILTYVVPSGVYDMVKNEAGTSVVDPNSFHFVNRTPTTIIQLFKAFYVGLSRNYSTIFLVMLVGGYFKVINETKAISNGLSILFGKMKDRALLILPFVLICFHILGTTGVVVNSVVAFIPLGLLVASQMGLDRIAAVGIIYAACYGGWGTSFMGATSVQLAQSIAGIPILSGVGLRLVVTAITGVATVIYVMRYCSKVKKDPEASYLYGTEWADFGAMKHVDGVYTFGVKEAIILVLTFGGIIVYVIGTVKYGWGNDWFMAILLFVAIVSGKLVGMSLNEIAQTFMKGLREMSYGAILIGWASIISVLLTDGKIIHTLIWAASLPLKAMPGTIGAVMMFLINSVFNFFVPSASGQAAIVMPIMGPLADVVGLSRQISVLAYQYGDGLSNTIVPTSGVLMGVLGVAEIPFQKWLKFMIPLFLIWTVICALAMVASVMIGYH